MAGAIGEDNGLSSSVGAPQHPTAFAPLSFIFSSFFFFIIYRIFFLLLVTPLNYPLSNSSRLQKKPRAFKPGPDFFLEKKKKYSDRSTTHTQ